MKTYKILILFASFAGLAYIVISLYYRFSFITGGSAHTEDMNSELKNILYDLPFFIPAITGLFYFVKKQPSKLSVTAFIIFLSSSIAGLYAHLFTADALETGLTILLFALPLCILSIILLAFCYVNFRKLNGN